MKTFFCPRPDETPSEIPSEPSVEKRTYYTGQPDRNLRITMTVYDRLLMELNHKMYYPESELKVFLYENALQYDDPYDKNLHYRQLLCTVLEILESLTNNIDIFRTIETEFATTGAAYEFLERRIQRLRQRIDDIPDEPILGGRGSDFSHIFVDEVR